MGHFLDMHMYITSALQKTDMKAVGLQLALDLLHEKVSPCFFLIKLTFSNFSVSFNYQSLTLGKARFGDRSQVAHHRRQTQLEQGFHSNPRAAQRPNHRLLLWQSHPGQSPASEMRRVRVPISKRGLLVTLVVIL